MKKQILILLLIAFAINSYAQTNYWFVDNYNASPLVTFNKSNSSWYYWNEYGVELTSNKQFNQSIQWMGQEVDMNLQLVFFPSRVYSAVSKRFFQPDPKSQYFSPYLYVNSDPVNNVDRDGKEGKPLILHEMELTSKGDFSERAMDLMSEFGDEAHYMSLSSFFNSKPIDLPNWNGNVFIDGHMHYARLNNMELERTDDFSKLQTLKTEGANLVTVPQLPGKYFVSTDSENVGKKLAEYSMKNRMPVKNVFVGGCEGGAVAEGIRDGFMKKIEPFGPKTELKAFGLKENHEALIAGKLHTSYKGKIEGLDHLRFYHPKSFTKVTSVKEWTDERKITKRFTGYKMTDMQGKVEDVPYLDASELRTAIGGEMGAEHRAFFEFHSAIY